MQTKRNFPEHISDYLRQYLSARIFTRLVIALILFTLSVATRYPLVDQYYEYSFEADSRRCVEETKSFYFYFKNPSIENFPDPLNAYPNYSDGDYIFSALMANILYPVFKSGIVPSHLSDADNTLVVFSMRWSGVLFDAAAMVFTFLLLLLLTQNALLSAAVCLFYYLLNPQTLQVDLIRIDHYGLFASAFVMWATVSLFLFPEKKQYYGWAGLAAGLVSATKINFPVYLLILALAIALLLFRKRLPVLNFILLAATGLLTAVFMYQRWLMYTENIYDTLKTTLTTGEQWFVFWGNKNYFYYLWQQFYQHGFSLRVLAFLLFFYASFSYCALVALRHRKDILYLLCATFLLQMLFLMFSPKVGRYGMIVPVWVAVFTATACSLLWQQLNKKAAPAILTALLLLSVFTYAAEDYVTAVRQSKVRTISIAETRTAPARWIQQHVPAYSVMGLQRPELSYPPVFEQPYIFTSEKLQYPFLDKAALSKLFPPTDAELKNCMNYLMISDKEKNFHLHTLQRYQLDSTFIRQWVQFYDSLPNRFTATCFTSPYDNYGVKNMCLYHLSDSVFYTGISPIQTHQQSEAGKITLYWNYLHQAGADAYSFQVQISDDSLMRWLVYGSRNGQPSKYRAANNPQVINTGPSMIPEAIQRALQAGQFDYMMDGIGAQHKQAELENFFTGVLVHMQAHNLTFQQALQQQLKGDAAAFYTLLASLYTQNILPLHLDDYLRVTGLQIDRQTFAPHLRMAAAWRFKVPVTLTKGKTYYWRVRFKDKDVVLSHWSNITRLKP